MDPAHLHLLLNHFPILGPIFGILLLLGGLLFRNSAVKASGLILLVFVAVITIPAYMTGEAAEEVVEGIAGISEAAIEEHERLAGVAFWTMMVTGGLALIALVIALMEHTVRRSLVWLVLVATTINIAAMTVTGFSGGKIRHTELDGKLLPFQGDKAPANEQYDDD